MFGSTSSVNVGAGVRTADPYRDTDVIDSRAPRFNQAVIGSLALVAFLTGFWPLLALLALQLALGLTLGRRWCLPCLAYFELVQPRFGEGPIEDSRPPRFANLVGVVVLGAASVLYLLGFEAAGGALGLLVAALALLAAATGFCAGCEIYRLGARLRGIRERHIDRVDLGDFAEVTAHSGVLVVEFTHPLCSDCRSLEERLRSEGRNVVTVDVRERPELARKYGIALVPTAVAIGPDGVVTSRLA
jgi:thiol-disulfide isomerase/thioredoxin